MILDNGERNTLVSSRAKRFAAAAAMKIAPGPLCGPVVVIAGFGCALSKYHRPLDA